MTEKEEEVHCYRWQVDTLKEEKAELELELSFLQEEMEKLTQRESLHMESPNGEQEGIQSESRSMDSPNKEPRASIGNESPKKDQNEIQTDSRSIDGPSKAHQEMQRDSTDMESTHKTKRNHHENVISDKE